MTTIWDFRKPARGSLNSALLRAAVGAMPKGASSRSRASKASSVRRRRRSYEGSRCRRQAQGARRRGRRLVARHARVQQLDARRVQERDRLAVAAGRGYSARVRRQARRRHGRVARRLWHAAVANRVVAGAEDARHGGVFRRPVASVARGRRVRRRRHARRQARSRAAREVPRGLQRVRRRHARAKHSSVSGTAAQSRTPTRYAGANTPPFP